MGSEDTHSLTPFDWATLVSSVRHGSCTPFLGAGVSAPPQPLGGELAKLLLEDWKAADPTAEHRYPVPPESCGNDLRNVAQFLALAFEEQGWLKKQIAERIRKVHPPDFSSPLEPHRYLADLQLPLYLTTNYDSFMMQALESVGKRPLQEFARWSEGPAWPNSIFHRKAYQPTEDEPMVFHLHGHTRDMNGIEAIVVSEDDYLDFMVNVSKDVAHRNSIIPLVIQGMICKTTLLFLGYGLRDTNLRVVLRLIRGTMKRSQHLKWLAVQLDPGDQEYKCYLEKYYFEQDLKLKVYWGTVRDFITALHSRLTAAESRGAPA